jgi:hypothetical protein
LPQSSSSLSDALLIALNCQSFVDFPAIVTPSLARSLRVSPLGRCRDVAFPDHFRLGQRSPSSSYYSESLTRRTFCETSLREVTKRRLLREQTLFPKEKA